MTPGSVPFNPVIGREDQRDRERERGTEGERRGERVYTENTQRGLTLFSLSLISSIRQRAPGEDRLHPI